MRASGRLVSVFCLTSSLSTEATDASSSSTLKEVMGLHKLLLATLVLAAVALTWANAMALSPGEKERLINELDLVEDDGSVETALMNYLFAKQIVSRLRSQLDVTDLQRKRSYWKQCAFNAVSCFGK